MKRKAFWPWIGVLVVATAAVAAYLLASWSGRRSEELDKARQDATREARRLKATEQPRRDGPAEKPETVDTAAKPGKHFPVPAGAIDPQARKALLAAILAKLAERERAAEAKSAADGAELPALPDGSADIGFSSEYLYAQLRELQPLFEECYQLARLEQPDLRGKIRVQVNVVADEELGGLVESSHITQSDPAVENETLLTCISETMYALKLKAPKGGWELKIAYPMEFSPERGPYNKAVNR